LHDGTLRRAGGDSGQDEPPTRQVRLRGKQAALDRLPEFPDAP
jgi:hypothetical protein